MKKVAIAAAVAGAFATSATAAELSTFIYQDYALGFTSDSSSTATKDVSSVRILDAGSNMVNFNYSDDLGNGLGLIGSFSMTARGSGSVSSGGVDNRNSFIGLNGDFGKITVGTHELMAELEAILKDGWDANYGGGGDGVRITRIANLGSSAVAASADGDTAAVAASDGVGFTARRAESIEWTSNDMNGLTLNVGYIENGGASSTVDAKGTELNAIYNVGSVRFSAGTGSHDDYGGTAGNTMDFNYVTASYDFGVASTSIVLANVEAKSGSTVYKQSGSQINITMPTANGRVIFNYAQQGDRDEDGTAQASSGFSGYDVGYMHDASANTKLYVRYLSQSLEDDYNYTSGAVDSDTLQFGMRYVY